MLLIPEQFPEAPLLPLVHHCKLSDPVRRALSLELAAQAKEMAAEGIGPSDMIRRS